MKVDGFTITAEAVEYIEGRSNYSLITMISGQKVLSSKTLGRLTDFLNLTRVHKCVAVNPHRIAQIEASKITMQSGYTVEPSRRKLPELLINLKEGYRLYHGATKNPTH